MHSELRVSAASAHAIAAMSKRKEPEDERAPAAAGEPPPPPRLGDHSSYMAEPLLPLADVRHKVKGGSTLLAHAMKLVETCGALARSSELFADATSKAPVALSSPFDEYAEADVARFFKCVYNCADAAASDADATLPAVVRLAHALDATPVLAAAQRRALAQLQGGASVPEIAAAVELAALCGWEDVRVKSEATLVHLLQTPPCGTATPEQQALSDVNAFDDASDVIDNCPPELAKVAFGTLAANFRRLHAKASAAVRNSALSPATAAAAALASAERAAIEVGGRFVAALDAPDFSDERPLLGAGFKSHGLEWRLILEPNGDDDSDGSPCVGARTATTTPTGARAWASGSWAASRSR